jgi:ABC-type uncharacterized transport system substrate-binding protein
MQFLCMEMNRFSMQFMLRCWVSRAMILLVLIVVSPIVTASELQHHEIRIAVSAINEQTKPVIEALQNKYPTAQVISETTNLPRKKKKAIYVAIGPSALRALLAKDPDGTIISVFVSAQTYKASLQASPKLRAGTTAIYADPAPIDQLRLVSLLYKRRVPVAVLVGEKTSHLISSLNQAATKADVDLTIQTVSAEDNLNRTLNRIDPVPAVLAIPDNTIYNNDNIRNILVTTYRSNQSLIGFSTSMVKAGALATTYSSVDDIVAQLAETIDEYDVSGRLPEPQFPKYFSTSLNENVARSLNIVIDDSVRNFSRKPTVK